MAFMELIFVALAPWDHLGALTTGVHHLPCRDSVSLDVLAGAQE